LLRVVGVKKNYATPQACWRFLGRRLFAGGWRQSGPDGRVGQRQKHAAAPRRRARSGGRRRYIFGRHVAATLARRPRGAAARDAGIVFQQFNLIPSLTVADNLAFQARIAAVAIRTGRAIDRRLGLPNSSPAIRTALGGQQQRVAVGGAGVAAAPAARR